MKQSRLFTVVLVSFPALVLAGASNLSAAVTSRNGFGSHRSSYYDSLGHWGDNPIVKTLYLGESDTFKIRRKTDSMQLLWNSDEIHGRNLFHDMLIGKTFFAVPNELLMPQIISHTSIPDHPSESNSDKQSTSKPADDIVGNNDADYIKSMRIPAPASLLLVALGLLSLRFTRRLRY